ncbi:hypothetical protein DM01DRAFT_1331900 [Hesseltinella vesiculosa]|uniref:Uncharacterized protein n=1 Tax=Hesseltinella vesiculosa TaxID=101127 RepID=A0A1X2GTE5_9FUNG|nr:hypothetical protein DM01DRAFT_1331900 [Hesseltinella vesiculosa]
MMMISANQEAQAYLHRYGIEGQDYNKPDGSNLADIAQQYRDLALGTMNLFGGRVERVLEGLDVKLDVAYGLTQEQRKQIVGHVEQALRRLAVQGQLVQDQVKARLDQLTMPNTLTVIQWQDICSDIVDIVTPPATGWFASLIGKVVNIGNKDPYHIWRDELVKSVQPIEHDADTTPIQTALDMAVHAENVGTPDWKYTTLQSILDEVKDLPAGAEKELETRLNAFSIFVHDFLDLPPSHVPCNFPSSCDEFIQQIKAWVQCAQDHLQQIFDNFLAKRTKDIMVVDQREDL